MGEESEGGIGGEEDDWGEVDILEKGKEKGSGRGRGGRGESEGRRRRRAYSEVIKYLMGRFRDTL